MERETLNGANISNFNCSVTYHQEKELGRMLQRLRNFYGAFKDKKEGKSKKLLVSTAEELFLDICPSLFPEVELWWIWQDLTASVIN